MLNVILQHLYQLLSQNTDSFPSLQSLKYSNQFIDTTEGIVLSGLLSRLKYLCTMLLYDSGNIPTMLLYGRGIPTTLLCSRGSTYQVAVQQAGLQEVFLSGTAKRTENFCLYKRKMFSPPCNQNVWVANEVLCRCIFT